MKKTLFITSAGAFTMLAACGNENTSNENEEFENNAMYTENEIEENNEETEEPMNLEEEEENNWYHNENNVDNENEENVEGEEAESSYEYGVDSFFLDVQYDDNAQMIYEYEVEQEDPAGRIEMVNGEENEMEDAEAINQIEEMLQEIQVYPASTEEEARSEILQYLETAEEDVTSFEMEMDFSDGESLEITDE
ncbi:YusW family protein [Alkalicoccus daliensis]|uniref:YusW-like protein n=1 Tax=Alkalicoccus daliensis TaxID=745820 RepID=A0A1H0FY14_9BACI|nr:YusW family protein [Alkalicoccus daliensis]SDN99454.1 YusW-like protein [Alkalicoccus daliensis]